MQTFFLLFLQKQKWNSTVFWLFLFLKMRICVSTTLKIILKLRPENKDHNFLLPIFLFHFFLIEVLMASLQNSSRPFFCQNNNFKKKLRQQIVVTYFFNNKKQIFFLTNWQHLFSLRSFLFFFPYFSPYKNFWQWYANWNNIS